MQHPKEIIEIKGIEESNFLEFSEKLKTLSKKGFEVLSTQYIIDDLCVVKYVATMVLYHYTQNMILQKELNKNK